MFETRRHMDRGEVLLWLLFALLILTYMVFESTKDSLLLILMSVIFASFTPTFIWFIYREFKVRLEKRGFLGLVLLLVSGFVTEWIWVKLCLALLGGGLILYDLASKRDLSNAELEE